MPYVLLNESGNVIAVSQQPLRDFIEVEGDDSRLAVFTASLTDESLLRVTDMDFVRVVEDIIDVLMEKNVIFFTDLPSAAQEKILSRQKLRDGLGQSLNLLGDE